jgi:hypothetical protein
MMQEDKHARCTYSLKEALTYQSENKQGQRKVTRRSKPTKISKFEEVVLTVSCRVCLNQASLMVIFLFC